MKLPWYKLRIRELLSGNDINKFDLDKYWHESLNYKLDSKEFEIEDFKQQFNNIAVSMGTFERLRETVKLWSDNYTIYAVNLSILFSSLYVCLVYPREGALQKIREKLKCNSNEHKVCEFFTASNSITRHIRNSLAHGTFEVKHNSIEFVDEDKRNNSKWREEYDFKEIELIILILFDLMMSFYEQNKLDSK